MAVRLLVLIAVPGCFSCNARTVPKNRAKVVEEYVVSANFDENKNLPQLSERSRPREIRREEETRSRQAAADDALLLPTSSRGRPPGSVENRNALEDGDYLVHHHHHLPTEAHPHPPAPPPPPPPPPPVGPPYPSPFFGLGFIAYLLLLNALQTSLIVTKSNAAVLRPLGPLGGLGGLLGRRRRSASENVRELLQKYGDSEPDLVRKRTPLRVWTPTNAPETGKTPSSKAKIL